VSWRGGLPRPADGVKAPGERNPRLLAAGPPGWFSCPGARPPSPRAMADKRARCPPLVQARVWAPEAGRLTLLVVASSPLAPLLQRRRGGLILLRCVTQGGVRSSLTLGYHREPLRGSQLARTVCAVVLRRSGAGRRVREVAIRRAVLAGGLAVRSTCTASLGCATEPQWPR
jgi:hypothetical protein